MKNDTLQEPGVSPEQNEGKKLTLSSPEVVIPLLITAVVATLVIARKRWGIGEKVSQTLATPIETNNGVGPINALEKLRASSVQDILNLSPEDFASLVKSLVQEMKSKVPRKLQELSNDEQILFDAKAKREDKDIKMLLAEAMVQRELFSQIAEKLRLKEVLSFDDKSLDGFFALTLSGSLLVGAPKTFRGDTRNITYFPAPSRRKVPKVSQQGNTHHMKQGEQAVIEGIDNNMFTTSKIFQIFAMRAERQDFGDAVEAMSVVSRS